MDRAIWAILDWLATPGSEFWSAIAGAVVGGFIAYILHRSALKEARLERESSAIEARKALAYSLFFKTHKVFEGLHGLKEHVDQSEKLRHDTATPLSSVMYPIANLPDRVTFGSDEMAMLLSLGDDDVFNNLVSLDSIHNSILPVWERYALLREKVQQLSTADHFDGESGAATLTVKRGSPLEIAIFEANQIADELANRARRDVADAKQAVIALQSLLSRKMGLQIGLTFPNS